MLPWAIAHAKLQNIEFALQQFVDMKVNGLNELLPLRRNDSALKAARLEVLGCSGL